MIFKRTLACLSLLFIAIFLFSQDDQNVEHVIESEAFGKERIIRVFLPARYLRDTTRNFAVTYVLDAQYDQLWNMAKSNIDYMVDSYSVIPMIAVGVVSDNRGDEFSPPTNELRRHIEEEIFPLIKENYRINDFKSIVGHSFGGAFIGHNLFSEHRDLFDAYIAISPSMGYNYDRILKTADSLMQAGTNFGKYLYGSSGDIGSREAEFGGYVNWLDSLIQKYPNINLAWNKQKFEGTDHWSCVIPSFGNGLVYMSRNYWADQKRLEDFSKDESKSLSEQVAAFNAHRDEVFGYHFESPTNYLRFVADDFNDQGKYKAAIETYQMAIDKDSGNLRAHFGMAKAYKRMEAKEDALNYFQKSLDLLEQQKESVTEGFYDGVKEWLKEEMEKLQ